MTSAVAALVKLASSIVQLIVAEKYDEAAEQARRLSIKLAAKKLFRRASNPRGK